MADVAGIFQGLGQGAQDLGEAYDTQQKFDMQRASMASEIARRAAESRYQQGYLQYLNKSLDMGSWQPAGKFYDPATGQFSDYERNVRSGETRRSAMPPGLVPEDSPQAKYQQIKQLFPDLDEKTARQWAAASLGIHNPAMGLTTAWRQVGNKLVMGTYNKMTGEFFPGQDGQGVDISKGLPLGMTPVMDANGNQVPYFYTRVGTPEPAPAQNGYTPIAPPLKGAGVKGSATGTTKTTTATTPPSSPVIKFAQMSNDGQNVFRNLKSAQPMLDELVQTIQQHPEYGTFDATGNFVPAKRNLLDQISDSAKAQKDWFKYNTLHVPPDDPLHAAVFPLSDLYRNLTTGVYLHGIRRGDLINQIRAHMPQPTDTPDLLLQKARILQELNPKIEQAILDFEKQNKQGLGAITVDQAPGANPNASSLTPGAAAYLKKKNAAK